MPSTLTLIAAGVGTAELNLRPSRAPDFEGENRALLRLAAAQTGPRDRLLQGIADAALDLCCAGSAGISLAVADDGPRCPVEEYAPLRWRMRSAAFSPRRAFIPRITADEQSIAGLPLHDCPFNSCMCEL
jgi:hypothetical protein